MVDRFDEDQDIERHVHAALRALPARRAPATLEARVLAEIERRQALPWWRYSFGTWPPAARVGFVVASVVLALAVMLFGPAPQRALDALPAHPLMAMPGASQVEALLASVAVLRSAALHTIPASWLTLALLAGTLLYALLFGLTAAVYRGLYLPAPLEVNPR